MFSQKIIITAEVYQQIKDTIGCHPAETGGMFGSNDGGKTITDFYYDKTARTSGGTYSPDVVTLNPVIADWRSRGTEFCGFAHSHPPGCIKPSVEDMRYVKRIAKAMGLDKLFMPIIMVSSKLNGDIQINPYSIDKKGVCRNQQIIIQDTPALNNEVAQKSTSAHTITAKEHYERIKSVCLQGSATRQTTTVRKPVTSAPVITVKSPTTANEQFDRIKSLYPLNVMRRKTIVCIGTGGTRGFIEDLARCGVGNFILIDGDRVSATNIATQQVYSSEIGKYKVEALNERILVINPNAKVTAVPRFLDDNMSDEEFCGLLGAARFLPKDILICGCTDSFTAQARAAALALKIGSPYLAGLLYKNGMAAEVYFNYPGVTTGGCQRCALSSRYKAYSDGYKNDVTSDGTPIFATSRVNSIKGQIALALLLYGEKGCVYGDMLGKIADRNFLLIRMNPTAGEALGMSILREIKSEMSFFDETLWIPQAPDKDCPLCGGNSDLSELKWKVKDTRTDWGE